MSDSGLPGREALPSPGGRVHLVGIGGAGMRGLAVLLDHLKYRVDGCDRSAAEALPELAARGIAVTAGHDPSHVGDADAVIRSSAVPEDAPEIVAALDAGIPVLRRARALGAALNGRPLAGISGTHGKTTITAMAGMALEAAGLDPTVMVGGHVAAWDGFARVGPGPAVVEADEYDRSFLELDPTLALVSSLEAEHLDTYGDFDGVRRAFREFASRAAGRTGVLYCGDDTGARDLGASLPGAIAYGFADDADLRISPEGGAGRWRLSGRFGEAALSLRVPGRHNARNAAGAFAITVLFGGSPKEAASGLAAFPGVGRRLEVLGSWGTATLVDDYAHHPTEVSASIEALRSAYPGAKLQVVFQPHLYTRTRDFASEFADALSDADEAYVLPIYPAREAPIEGVTSALITGRGAGAPSEIDRDGALALVVAAADTGEPRVLAFMGAGDVTGIAREAARRAASRGAGGAVGA